MTREKSWPEKRAQTLFDRLGLSEILRNDGSIHPKAIHFHESRQGTSLIKDGRLFSDYPPLSGKSPKCYKKSVPDYLLQSDYVEVKGNISGRNWERLGRDALNDNIRLALLRMKMGYIKSILMEYHDLEPNDKDIADCALELHKRSNPKDRFYIHWNTLIQVIPSPDQNLTETVLNYNGLSLPIKLLTGMDNLIACRLFVVDHEIMSKWDKL